MNDNLKDKAVEFLQMIVSGEIREAYKQYVSPNFKHHNPYLPGDAQSLMLAMEENADQTPNKSLEVKHHPRR